MSSLVKNQNKICKVCGAIYYRGVGKSQVYWDRRKFCSLDCYHKNLLNKKPIKALKSFREKYKSEIHWNWKGGISKKDNYQKLLYQKLKIKHPDKYVKRLEDNKSRVKKWKMKNPNKVYF